MRFGVGCFICGKCGHEFDAPQLLPELYGTFLLRSANGSLAVLEAIEDQTYEEVEALIKPLLRQRRLSEDERIDVLQDIYGELACDPDQQGAPYSIGRSPICPACGADKIAGWEFKKPSETIEVDATLVTHTRWRTLSADQKHSEAQLIIDKYMKHISN